MPIENVIKLVSSLQLRDVRDESINNWNQGVVRALKKYVNGGEIADIAE